MISVMLTAALLCGCGEEPRQQGDAQITPEPQTGSLVFIANGEDFATRRFESKDGWMIDFDHVYVTVDTVTGYVTDPPFDPHGHTELESSCSRGVEGPHTLDLAGGPAAADSVLEVPAGHYNALSWRMVPAPEGPSKDFSVLLQGIATRGDESIEFEIGVENSYIYEGGEYVGESRKGLVEPGETADLEMTFHLDHVFGTAELPPDDPLNAAAVGFGPFAELAGDRSVEVTLSQAADMLAPEEYRNLEQAIRTLGHVGEGHCRSEVLEAESP